MNKPKTFQKLVTRAHDMELTITYCERRLDDDESIPSSRNRKPMLGSKEKKCPYSEFDAPACIDLFDGMGCPWTRVDLFDGEGCPCMETPNPIKNSTVLF